MWVNYMSKYSNIYCIDWSKCEHNLPIKKMPSTLRHASQLWKLFACCNRSGNLIPAFKLFSHKLLSDVPLTSSWAPDSNTAWNMPNESVFLVSLHFTIKGFHPSSAVFGISHDKETWRKWQNMQNLISLSITFQISSCWPCTIHHHFTNILKIKRIMAMKITSIRITYVI